MENVIIIGNNKITKSKKIIIASDHAAFNLKELLKEKLKKDSFTVLDLGCDSSTKLVNYAEYGFKLAQKISNKEFDRGILLCGSGIGMSIIANKVTGIRAALCNDVFSAELSRKHNNSNVLVMGGRIIGDILAYAILDKWLITEFEGGRHEERLNFIESIERHHNGK